MRTAEINRKTAETQVSIAIDLDGDTAKSGISTGVGFLDHMLELFARHGGFEARIACEGDTYVDDHHSVEDIGIALGEAFRQALGEKRGIRRYASLMLPMDESLVLIAVDISGRGGCYTELTFRSEKIGTFDTELVEEFLNAFAQNAGLTLHVRQIAGGNSHHLAEACFKGLGRAMREAVSIDERFADAIPSTKGTLG